MITKSSNFIEVKMGKIFPKLLYRSNHPICNGEQVRDIILSANNAKIKTIINLSDNIKSIKSKIMYCPWYKKMFENNNVIVLNINMKFDITDEVFNKKLKDGLMFMIEHNPPYLIHCEAGIDRTGFLSIILGSFMGAEFGDIVKDYMLSFVDNDEYSGADYKNGSLFIINQFNRIKSELKHSNENLQCLSKRYMLEKIKLNINEIQILENKLMNKEK